MNRWLTIAIGLAAALATAALWHGPLGGSERFIRNAEGAARVTLDNYEMYQVQARLEGYPIRRRLLLSGPADDFQRRELIRILDQLPGIGDVRWVGQRGRSSAVAPMLLETETIALVAFSIGLILAYLVELRRRTTRQWRW